MSPAVRLRMLVLATAIVATMLTLASPASAGFEVTAFDGGVFDLNGEAQTQAGSHPASGWTDFTVTGSDSLRDVAVDLPPGLIGNPQAISTACSAPATPGVDPLKCPVASQVGVVVVDGGKTAVYMVEPAPGTPAVFKFFISGVPVYVTARVRTGGDYGITAVSQDTPTFINTRNVKFTFWGTPADPINDVDRGEVCASDPSPSCTVPYPGVDRKAFITLPTSCTGPVETFIDVASWQGGSDGASFLSHDNAVPVPNPIGNDGCESVPFSPTVSIAPTSTVPDSASGVVAAIGVPSDGLIDPEEVSQAHLEKAVVTLPEGVSVNPSTATGLAGCSDAQLSLDSAAEPSCPDASRIGSVRIESPVLADDEVVTGEIVLRTPTSTDPMSGGMLRMAIVARNVERGVLVKLPGSATADPTTGRLTATFDENPQLPFGELTASFKGGQRGVLAMPQGCGEIATTATLTPWSGGAPTPSSTPVAVAGDCSLGFAPNLDAGMSNRAARAGGAFSFEFARRDGEQWVNGLIAELPQGLLASVREVPLCSDAHAAAGTCPAESRIGSVDATAGTGDPFVLEQKGSAYLTEGYKGCAYGLVVVVPVVAGPFDKSSPATDLGDIVVRQRVCVDRSTAQVTAISDPFPTIWHGIPLRVRSVTVSIDRSGFMLNPSGCSSKQVAATLFSVQGTVTRIANPFSVTGCTGLPFKPKLALRLSGRRQVTTGRHPGINALVTQQGVSEAGIEKAVVRLPKSLALDPDNAQTLCEFVDGTKPDLENHCPKGSIVGRARARTPLLENDLVGNVYFVKNVRVDPRTGNQIRTLPMIIVALRGEIAINLKGESSTTKGGKLVNTFASVPDAPITRFNLNIKGGSNGIIAVTRTRKAKINLCAGRHIAEADMDAQNGRRHDFDVRMKTPCTKRQVKRAKRAAAKARKAAKR